MKVWIGGKLYEEYPQGIISDAVWPDTDEAYDMGTSSYRWRNTYSKNFYSDNLYLGNEAEPGTIFGGTTSGADLKLVSTTDATKGDIFFHDASYYITSTGVLHIGNNLYGPSGGLTITGGTGSGDDLLLVSTTNATKGDIQFHSSSYYITSAGYLYIDRCFFGSGVTETYINNGGIKAGQTDFLIDAASGYKIQFHSTSYFIDENGALTVGAITCTSVDSSGKIDGATGVDIAGTNVIDSNRKLANFQGYSGTMPTRCLSLTPSGAIVPATGGPEKYAKDGTNHSWVELRFDKATDECVYFNFVVPDNYSGGDFTVKIHWYAPAATTGDVVWAIATESITDGTAWDVALDAVTGTVTETTDGTAGNISISSISCTANADWAAGEPASLKLYRDADNASDTLDEDAHVVLVEIEYPISS